jgi:hypothetical protein
MAVLTELSLRLPNSPGALGDVCRLLAAEHVSIVALGLEPGGRLRVVIDNHIRAEGALREHHHAVTRRDVLVVEGGRGHDGLASALGLLAAAGINVEYAYAGIGERHNLALVLGVDDPVRAATAAGV